MVLTRIKSKWNERRGDFQPLSWYEHQGYDTSQFSEHLDKEFNHDMGVWTYRVKIHGGGERMQEELARTEITKLLKKQPGERAPRKRKTNEVTTNETMESGVPEPTAEAENAGEVNRETGAEPSSSQSSTTTTSSSSSARHRIKRKKTRRTRREHGSPERRGRRRRLAS